MPDGFRRYEVTLPLRFNDGLPVPRDLLHRTSEELRERFRAVSFETQRIIGSWTDEASGTVDRDENVRVVVDAPDLPEHREFFVGYKATLKERFRQSEIWLTSTPLEVL
jgi:hypothetical protein